MKFKLFLFLLLRFVLEFNTLCQYFTPEYSFVQDLKTEEETYKMGDIQECLTSTTFVKEEANFRWTIKNFSRIEGPTTFPSPMVFEVGESIGYPSKVKMELRDSGTRFNGSSRVEMCLTGVELANELSLLDIECEVRIRAKDQDQNFISVSFISVTSESCSQVLTDIQSLRDRALLMDDELLIYLKFIISVDKLGKSSSSCSKEITEECLQLSLDLGNLLESGNNSDFEIQVKSCDGEVTKMKVHKAVLGSRSPVFQNMFEAEMTESSTGTVVMKDLSAECVSLMLKWIYTGTMGEEWKKIPEEIVAAADKYDLQCVRNFLDAHLHEACTFGNAWDLRKVARLHRLERAITNVKKFIRANFEEIMNID